MIPPAMPSFASLVHTLRHRAETRPDAPAYTYLTRGERVQAQWTYAELAQRARAVAGLLRAEGVAPGDRVLLAYPPGLGFVAAFYGCLERGAVAVPAPVPRHAQSAGRLKGIAEDAGARLALTTAELAPALASALPDLKWRATEGEGEAPAGSAYAPAPEDVAFLQYTSGSTARPKGVMVTHGNLVANTEAIAAAYRTSDRSVFVSWLPLFHDMGLIGIVLHAVHVGAHAVLMAPLDFIQKPMRWWQAASTWQATLTGGPNFAYDLCARRATPEAVAALDLTRLTVAFNGAEPVHAGTLDRFAAAFAPACFTPVMSYPCYGLAEATLFVTGGEVDQAPLIHGGRVSCGRAWAGHEVAVVDPETRLPVPDGAEGEVWVHGPSVAAGYWNRPEATAEVFDAVRADTGRGGYLRTGDLGVLTNGELILTGRRKDLIILEGRNLYPQDLERTVEEAHPGVRPTGVAAFSVSLEGREALVLVAEIEPPVDNLDALRRHLREAVALQHEAEVHDLVLTTARVPKTSSGKHMRTAAREAYLSGAFTTEAP